MNFEKQEIAVIGGGAAGFFTAFTCAKNFPQHRVTIYEKSNKLLSKVRVSGGGRCNVTHACTDIQELVKNYPRGEKQLINAFARFSVADTIQWFEEQGVRLKTEEDGRMFPVTDNSETIVNCLMEEAEKFQVKIILNAELVKLSKNNGNKFELTFKNENKIMVDKVLIAAGGHPKAETLSFLHETGHELISPVPSLFTFNMPGDPVKELMGVSVPLATLQVVGSKLVSSGPLLITHWGMSGPAVLKLSALAARDLAGKNYQFDLTVCWITEKNTELLQKKLVNIKKELGSKEVYLRCPFDLPKRLWRFLLLKLSFPETVHWADLSNEQVRKLARVLTQDHYNVHGKTTFKEEFVTCGGVSLRDVDFRTMESKKCTGIYFAGEVLDIDALTGGYNFQAAWTTGYLAGMNIGKQESV